MDSVERTYTGACIEDSPAEVLLPSESEQSNHYNVFGEPDILPRVGDEYQAEIPALISQPCFIQLRLEPLDEPTDRCGPRNFRMGLPMQVMWVPLRPDNTKHEQQEFDAGTYGSSIKRDGLKLDNKIKFVETIGLASPNVERRTFKRCTQENCFPVPGLMYNLWNEPEEANFLLGLYIFGKNLVQVKKLMENKSMGEILSFYYGKFYGSAKYRRWSMCRKMKSRRCVYGQKIFTGLRQRELLSRLLSQLSQESQSKLLEASRAYGEGKTSLEEYVFTLKAIAGLKTLVQVIGIGKGKRDLTRVVNDHAKSSNQNAPLCSEIPVGKACSVLTTLEIVTLLTGNFRLSKARSNDLFWEAVWPRLLARGWHSEQPENGFSTGSRPALVFLVPGVKKFSKRKLVKGDHYFDSVSDVLSKVASQPELLDLDAQRDVRGGTVSKDGGKKLWEIEAKLDREDSPEEERLCYLKPRTPTQSGDGIKFTIVDTSIAVKGIASELREPRTLPPDISSSSFTSHFEEDNGESSNLSMEEADISKFVKVNNGEKRDSSQPKDVEDNDLSSRNHQKKVLELQAKQRIKPKCKKRQKLDVSNCSLRSCSGNEVQMSTGFELELATCCSSNPRSNGDVNMNILQVGPSTETLSSTNSPSRDVAVNSSYEPENLREPWTVIDLNLPPYPEPELTDQGLQVQTDARSNVQRKLPLQDSNARRSPSHADNTEQQPSNGRRQSMRNRPLTTKALEALALGLFDTRRKRKSQDEFPYEMESRHPPGRGQSQDRADDGSCSAGFVELGMEGKAGDDKFLHLLFP